MTEIKKILFDKEKLKHAISEKNYTYKSLSEVMGYGESYISDTIKRGCLMRIGDYKLMCSYLEVREDDLKPNEEIKNDAATIVDFREHEARVNQMLSDLTKYVGHRMDEIQKSIDAIGDDVRACRSNTNTLKIQSEKIKEKIDGLRLDTNDALADITDKLAGIVDVSGSEKLRQEKAFLAKILNEGPYDENKIYLEAQKSQIAKKYVDRAKSELGVLVETKGYGNNKTKNWYFG